MAKIISSKETYFKRSNSSIEAWEAYKAANPGVKFVGEECWALHDTMLLRNKPAVDSIKIIKKLLDKVGIEYVKDTEDLQITSDLTGLVIPVVEIECDLLLEQLCAAGAQVVYFTSNVNYNTSAPDRYFEMYPENYQSTDYPAIDKRTLFTGKNIIVKYVNFNYYKSDLFSDLLYNTIVKETDTMTPNKVLMNPPYAGSLHLDVLSGNITTLKRLNPNVEIVSVQPCDWLENPLTEFKDGKYKKFFNSEILNVSNLQVVDVLTAQKSFNIGTDVDLGIYTYKPTEPKFNLENLRTPVANTAFTKIINKILVMQTLADELDEDTVAGWRCKLNELRPQSGGTNPNTNGYSSKTWGIQLISSTEAGISECVFKDGYNDSGIYWTDVRSKNQFGKNVGATFRHSIEFENKQLAINFAESCNTNFYRNWIHLIKFNQHMPLRFLPYMGDYSKVWTDEDYCKFFDLTKEESEFMCRTVDDFRVKDFINYISLED